MDSRTVTRTGTANCSRTDTADCSRTGTGNTHPCPFRRVVVYLVLVRELFLRLSVKGGNSVVNRRSLCIELCYIHLCVGYHIERFDTCEISDLTVPASHDMISSIRCAYVNLSTCLIQGPASLLRKLGPVRVPSAELHFRPRIWNSRVQSGVRSRSDGGSSGGSLVRVGLRYSLVYHRPWHSHETEAFFRRGEQD